MIKNILLGIIFGLIAGLIIGGVFYFNILSLLNVFFNTLKIDIDDVSENANTIIIKNFSFNPQILIVPVGTQMTWKNQDNMIHAIVADDSSFISPDMNNGDEYNFIFNTVGEFDYHCRIHPSMTGKIIVQ